MAQLDYTAPQTLTRNQAHLLEFHVARDVTAAGVLTGLCVVRGVIQIGHFTGGNFTEIERKSFSERAPLATVNTFFGAVVLGGSVLATIERKVLEWAQSTGLLPAGVIT